MSIKIPRPKGFSNKPQTLQDNGHSKVALKPTTSPSVSSAPVPFIDKISIVLEPACEADAYDIHSALFSSLDDKKTFMPLHGGKFSEFKLARRLAAHDIEKKCPLLQYAYVNATAVSPGKATKIRIEFVPVDLGYDGLIKLHSILVSIIPGGWHYVIEHGRITRIDVAVDFPTLQVDDFHLLTSQGLTTTRWKVDGKLQTATYGKRKSNQTVIYSRAEKRKALKQSSIGKEGIRIERRIKQPTVVALSDLKNMPNPFAKLTMVSLPLSSPEPYKLYIWDLFRHAVSSQGLPAALALLPIEKRTSYRKHIELNAERWWSPEAIWASWPKMLDELELCDPGFWY